MVRGKSKDSVLVDAVGERRDCSERMASPRKGIAIVTGFLEGFFGFI
jgi:hypothetical protein